ncbi:Gfo/Idh/MocA family protein [Absicoccus intestinalis]|uniref:Gfo/Idh/MocA family oxidoreductase n=1 Tax=Absicoccus intestinalis TaxID=2926319 RepID=A0ABU4WJB0_9FIRM|nr:Gfo/Idh/MocA family oxidoreductase [Absicoccus sp. CLA-KB-P134]MDX8416348.1 Gfo/Idh/MocA family oxidoreductase [Absicoccus sp. CLA-KB-P134]
MQKLKVAVVGAGLYGRNHLNAYTWNPNAELVAVCDKNKQITDAVERDYKVATYNDVDEMLDSMDIDAVSVATPDPYHKEPVLSAIHHGKDVLVEKPLATSSEDAYEIIDAAKEAHVRVMVDYHKRWDPASIAVKNKLMDKSTGAPIRGYMRMDNIYDVALCWLKWAADSSPVHFVGTHCYDLIRYYMNCDVTEVYAVGHKGILQSKGVDTWDTITANLTFENGCTWTVENAWILPNGFAKADDGCTEILCENEMIRVDSQKRGVEFFDDQKQTTPNVCFIQNANGRPMGFGIEPLNDFVDCILNDKPFYADLNDGLEAELIAEAVHKSASIHQAVKIERRK